MSMKIIAAAIIGLMLVILPIGYAQNVEEVQKMLSLGAGGGAGGVEGQLNAILDFVTGRLPLALGDLFEVVMHFIFAVITALQSALAILLNPQGFPLLINLIINGVIYAFNYAITFAVYGGIIGAVLVGFPFWPLTILFGIAVGAMAGIAFGFIYGFLGAGREIKMPAELVNPWIKDWPEGFVS